MEITELIAREVFSKFSRREAATQRSGRSGNNRPAFSAQMANFMPWRSRRSTPPVTPAAPQSPTTSRPSGVIWQVVRPPQRRRRHGGDKIRGQTLQRMSGPVEAQLIIALVRREECLQVDRSVAAEQIDDFLEQRVVVPHSSKRTGLIVDRHHIRQASPGHKCHLAAHEEGTSAV